MAASVYYIDNANGLDVPAGVNANWGKREPTTGHWHSDGITDETHTICSSLPIAVDDAYNNAFIWNRTRGAGALVTDYVGLAKQLVHGNIAGNVQTDEFYLIQQWKTFSKAATTAAVGDVVYIRAGTTEIPAATIDFTNDGTPTLSIQMIGMGTGTATLETTDETATEAWHDAGTC